MKNIFLFALLTLVYVLLGQICLALAVPPGYSSPLWLPIGVSVGALFALSLGVVLPATFLGSLIVNFLLTQGLRTSFWDAVLIALVVALGSSLCVLVAFSFIRQHDRSRTVKKGPVGELRHLLLMVPLCTLPSSTCGSLILWSLHFFDTDYLFTNWAHWWVGDSIGILLTLPGFYVFASQRVALRPRRLMNYLLPFLGGLLALVLTFRYTNKTEVDALQEGFSRNAGRVASSLEEALRLDAEMLHTMVSFYEGSDLVEEVEFRDFLNEPMKSHRNLQQVLWLPSLRSPLYKQDYSFAHGTDALDPLFVRDRIWKRIGSARSPVLGPQIQNMQVLVYPVVKRDLLLGMLVGLVNSEKMIANAARHASMIGYQIELTDRDTGMATFWKNGNLLPSEMNSHEGLIRHVESFPVLNHVWSVDVVTTRSELYARVPREMLLLLFFGLAFAYFLCAVQMLLYFLAEKTDQSRA